MQNRRHGLARLLAPAIHPTTPKAPLESLDYARQIAWGLVHALEAAIQSSETPMPALADSLQSELVAARQSANRLDLLTRISASSKTTQ